MRMFFSPLHTRGRKLKSFLHRAGAKPWRGAIIFSVFLLGGFSPGHVQKASDSVQPSSGLEAVLSQMDVAAAQFRSAEADFVWDQFQKVVNETDTQKGKIYFRRSGKGDIQMALNVTSPEQKSVVFADGKLRMYQPKVDQVNEYDVGKNRDEVETFLVLGFGGRGHDLQRQFEVKYEGTE